MPKLLRYIDFGPPMRWTPVNYRDDQALLQDLINGKTAFVMLEPGDATRYDLAITWLRPHYHIFNLNKEDAEETFMVVRHRGGQQPYYAGMVMGRNVRADVCDAIRTISCQNAWTETLFKWWFTELCLLLPEDWRNQGCPINKQTWSHFDR